jgi:2-iminobutanoate/2-iminopropanoate deaminase
MKKDTIAFGEAMGMKVAFCNGVALDLSAARRMIWISGQISFDAENRFIGRGNIRLQTEQVLKNIRKVLQELGGTLDDVVQVTGFVKDMTGLRDIHGVRLKYFNAPYPTSTLVEVKGFVHPDALIEINAMAVT